MLFASDNTGPVHPKVLEALAAANTGYAPGYGNDPLTQAMTARLRDVFEAPQAAVYLVATGTAANALLLGCLCQPWQAVFCAEGAHVDADECGAPEFYSGGAKLRPIATRHGRMDPADLHAAMSVEQANGVHGVQPGPVTLTQATEAGTVYPLAQIQALAKVAHDFGQPLHMDGARFANALVRLGCSPADMTWKAGVDAVSFGGTKNGLMGVEAAILFDPAKAWEFELRRKRGAHLFSKHRYLAAQMQAYLTDDLWLDMARRANAANDRLTTGLAAAGLTLAHPPEANAAFPSMPRRRLHRLIDAGAPCRPWSHPLDGDPDQMLTVRLVCDWSMPDADIDRFLALLDRTT
jgi:threonine aldolase